MREQVQVSSTEAAVPVMTAAVTTDAERSERSRRFDAGGAFRKLFGFDELGALVALGLLVLVIGLFHGDFLQKTVLVDTIRQAAFVAIVAYGMVFLLRCEVRPVVGGAYAVALILAAKWMANGGISPGSPPDWRSWSGSRWVPRTGSSQICSGSP